MPEDNTHAAPIGAAWQPTAEQIVRSAENAWATRELAKHDAQRAAAPKVKLVAVTDFTVVDDENPDGRTVRMGETFEVSEFDLGKFLGKGLPAAPGYTPEM